MLNRRIMFRNRFKLAVGMSWLHRCVTMLTGILLTPLLYRYVSNQELALWLLISTSQPFLGLLGFGLHAVMTRQVSMVSAQQYFCDQDRIVALKEVYNSAQILFRVVAIATWFIGSVIGCGFLYLLHLQGDVSSFAVIAWLIFLTGYCVSVLFATNECFLFGLGHTVIVLTVQAASTILMIAFGMVIVFSNAGIVGLASVHLAVAVLQYLVFWIVVQRMLNPGHSKWIASFGLIKTLFRSIWRSWFFSIGVFFAMQCSSYFIVYLSDIEVVPQYAVALSLTFIPFQMAVSYVTVVQPAVSQAWRKFDLAEVRRLCLRSLQFGMLVVGVGHGFALTCAEEFLLLWVGPNRYIGWPMYLFLVLLYTSECLQYILTAIGRATDDDSYVWSACASAVLLPAVIFSLFPFIGLLAVPGGMLLSQTLIVTPYALLHTSRRIQLPIVQIVQHSFLPWSFVVFLVIGVGYLARHFSIVMFIEPLQRSILQIVIVGLFCVFVLFLSSRYFLRRLPSAR